MKCILCRKKLNNDEVNICKTCFEILKIKYKDQRKLKEVIEWHKKHTKELEEEGWD